MNEWARSQLASVETQYYHLPEDLVLETGQKLKNVTLAYETYGKLNKDKSNAILILHAFSGDAHAAGWHPGDKKPGWWDIVIGPGKAFDTEKYFVICSNFIGGCKGSTGPSSIDPDTGKPYGTSFPGLYYRRHGSCPEEADRLPGHQAAVCSRRRLGGRHAGAPVGCRVSGHGAQRHRYRHVAPTPRPSTSRSTRSGAGR